MGRRSKLTNEVVEKICESITIGATNRIAGLYAGVAESTILGWLKTAREETERREQGEKANRKLNKYMEFLRKYEESEGTAFIGWLTVIDNSAQSNPQWASYMLERRDRAYAARSGLDIDMTSRAETYQVLLYIPENTRQDDSASD